MWSVADCAQNKKRLSIDKLINFLQLKLSFQRSVITYGARFLSTNFSQKVIIGIWTKAFGLFPVSILISHIVYMQARSQKFAMGGAVWGVWGRSPQPPEANGGLGAKPPAAGGWGFGGKAPSRRRHGGLGAEPPALENFAFFCKNNFILGLFWLKNNDFKTWLRNWQCKQD